MQKRLKNGIAINFLETSTVPPKPRAEGSSPSAPAKMKAHLLMCFLFYKKQKESKATVKKTVRWTVFRESVDASFLSYLCFISVVGTFAKLIVFCPCQAKHLKNSLGMRFLGIFLLSNSTKFMQKSSDCHPFAVQHYKKL